jgi:hypothetical protein
MNRKTITLFALALGALAATGSAQARDVDVQWSVTIGSPRLGVVVGAPVYAQPVYAQPVHAPRVHAPRVITQPVVVLPPRGAYAAYGTYGTYGVAHGRGWKDADRDGIPNRYDRVYNPRWDVDGDGVPNRYDRRDRNPYRR